MTTEGSELASSSVAIARGEEHLRWQEDMPLERGDVVTTDAHTTAVVSFAGAQALIKPNSSVTLGSIFTWFGSIFVSGPLVAKTKVATAVTHGTKYHVQVDRETSRTTFTVIEGEVRVSPVQGKQETITLRPGQRVAVGAEKHGQTESISAEELHALTEEVYALGKPRGPVLPELVGMPHEAARRMLAELGVKTRMELVEAPLSDADGGQSGHVLRQEPAARVHSPNVTLTVAANRVPSVMGERHAAAELTLKGAHLVLGHIDDRYHAHDAQAVVVAQNPNAGELAVPGEAIDLVLASVSAHTAKTDGPEASHREVEARGSAQSQNTEDVPMPDVTGARPEVALAVLHDAGITAWVEASPRSSLSEARVIMQEPVPGAALSRGLRVRLVVAIPAADKAHDAPQQAQAEPVVAVSDMPSVAKPSAQQLQALRLLDEALTLAEQAKWLEARSQLEHAQALAEFPNILFHLARADFDVGETEQGRRALSRFTELAGLHNPNADEAARLRVAHAKQASSAVASPSHGPQLPVGPLATIGGGGAALFTALVTGLLTRAAHDELDRNCASDGLCPSRLSSVRDHGERLKIATNLLLGVGVAAVGVGTGWWIYKGRERARTEVACTSDGCRASTNVAF